MGANPSPLFPYLPRAVPQRQMRDIYCVEVALQRHLGLLLVLCDILVRWWGVRGSMTKGRTRCARVFPREEIAGQQ